MCLEQDHDGLSVGRSVGVVGVRERLTKSNQCNNCGGCCENLGPQDNDDDPNGRGWLFSNKICRK